VFDVSRIRESFPYLAHNVYLNTASVGLSWAGQGRAAAEFYELKAEGTGAMRAWTALADATRRELATLLHVSPATIDFFSNTTEALNLIALAIPLRKGDEVVVADDEFPSVVMPWTNLLQSGVRLVRVPVTQEAVRTRLLCEAVGRRTRVVAVSHVHWRTGTRVDLSQLTAACRARECRLVVDGVQAVGALPVDAAGVDAYCASVFKWLLSGFGLAFVSLSERLAGELNPVVRGYTNGFPSRTLRYSHLNYPGIFALHATLGYLKSVGWQGIHQRVDALAMRTITSLRDQGFEVLTPENAHGGIVSIRHPQAATAVRLLAAQAVQVEDAHPIVRASTHFYNTEEDIDRFLEGLIGNQAVTRKRDHARRRDPAA
jgi:selenocysteine lyase/cysteine desulfurase